MKIGDEVYIHGYIDEIRKDTIIIKNEGGYFGTVADEIVSGELRTKQDIDSVIENIKAEIQALPKTYPFINHIDTYVKEDDVVDIIRKHIKVGDTE